MPRLLKGSSARPPAGGAVSDRSGARAAAHAAPRGLARPWPRRVVRLAKVPLIACLVGAAVALTAAVGAAGVAAAPVYRWVDEGGLVHFGDEPPPDGAGAVERVEVEPGSPAAGDDYYSVVNQARRMEAQRLERERHRAEVEALRREAAPAGPAPPPPPEPVSPRAVWVVPPGYWGPGYRPGHWPPVRPGWDPRPGWDGRPRRQAPPRPEPPRFSVDLPQR